MVIVILTVGLAGTAGVLAQRRLASAGLMASWSLALMLYALVPFVSLVNIAHLHLTAAGGTGLLLGYLALGVAGLAAAVAGRLLALPRPQAGALICAVILVNTGYLGLPMTVVLLGSRELGSAIVYDQLISGPMLLVVGFAIGAAYGTRAGEGGRQRTRAYLTRNPPLLAVLAGLLMPAAWVPAALVDASHVVVGALLPLGFFVVGVNLAAERREDAGSLLQRPDRRVLTAVALRLLLPSSLLLLSSAVVLKLPSAYLLQSVMPTGVNSLLVGHAYGLDQRLIASAIVWSTLISLLLGLGLALL